MVIRFTAVCSTHVGQIHVRRDHDVSGYSYVWPWERYGTLQKERSAESITRDEGEHSVILMRDGGFVQIESAKGRLEG